MVGMKFDLYPYHEGDFVIKLEIGHCPVALFDPLQRTFAGESTFRTEWRNVHE